MGTIDVWGQITTPKMDASTWMKSLKRWTQNSGEITLPTVESTLKAMDDANIDIMLLSAWWGRDGELISNENVAEKIKQSPDRFKGLATVDLNDPMKAVREIRRCADSGQFVGVRVVPWLWDLPPNDRRYYPIYVACIEAGIPLCTQIGHTGPLCRSEPGRLIPYLEDVLLDFPELVVVGGHVGFPWIDEVISMAHKFPNFYVDTSAYVVHRLPHDLVEFMRNEGRSRVMFGTNWPMLSPQRCLSGLDNLDLDDDIRTMFLSGNARKVFNLK